MAYHTKLLKSTAENIEYAAELIGAGEVVGMPTETVYGLAADAFNAEAVAKIFKAKERPADKYNRKNPRKINPGSFPKTKK